MYTDMVSESVENLDNYLLIATWIIELNQLNVQLVSHSTVNIYIQLLPTH